MFASDDHIAILLDVQEADRQRFTDQAQLKALDHQQRLDSIRSRRSEVLAKLAAIEDMYSDQEQAFEKLAAEDELQARKQAETQAKIAESQGDYRSVQSLTRDLEGMAKRRETLEFEMGKADARLGEIDAVRTQARNGVAALDAQEKQLADEYRAIAGQLVSRIKDSTATRNSLIAQLPDDVAGAYEAAVERCGGIGLAQLSGTRCGACRNEIDPNRLLQINKEAPLSQCPSCKRMLIVTTQES